MKPGAIEARPRPSEDAEKLGEEAHALTAAAIKGEKAKPEDHHEAARAHAAAAEAWSRAGNQTKAKEHEDYATHHKGQIVQVPPPEEKPGAAGAKAKPKAKMFVELLEKFNRHHGKDGKFTSAGGSASRGRVTASQGGSGRPTMSAHQQRVVGERTVSNAPFHDAFSHALTVATPQGGSQHGPGSSTFHDSAAHAFREAGKKALPSSPQQHLANEHAAYHEKESQNIKAVAAYKASQDAAAATSKAVASGKAEDHHTAAMAHAHASDAHHLAGHGKKHSDPHDASYRTHAAH